MTKQRARWERLKKANGIKKDVDILREIYWFLREHGETKETEKDFIDKKKGSFHSMIDGARSFDARYYYPMEKKLHTSGPYITDGIGEEMNRNEQRGIRNAAYTDTVGNYETLIAEGVVMEQDEYQFTLLDYMIDFESENGFEFFASKDMLPFNEICIYRHGHNLELSQRQDDSLACTMIKVCKPATMLKYLNGFYFAERGQNPDSIEDDARQLHEMMTQWLANNEPIRIALSNCKRIPLAQANPGAYSNDGKPLGETVFVNYFFNLMLEMWWLCWNHIDEGDRISLEVFSRAIELNKEAMETILSLGYQTYRLSEHGYVYAGRMLCGSIAVLPSGVERFVDRLSEATVRKYNELVNQIQEFQDKITADSRVSVIDGEMRLTPSDDSALYSFYKLVKESRVTSVALWLEEKCKGKDRFELPAGKQMPIHYQGNHDLYKQALRLLASVDAIGEKDLGEGKTYVFPELTNRFFFVDDEKVTGIAPSIVTVGGRYDNLAEFLAQTTLTIPVFVLAGTLVTSIATSLKTYGLNKKEAERALPLMREYLNQTASALDPDDENNKSLIAAARTRATWLELYTKEIISQIK